MKKTQPETAIVTNIVEKIMKKYPNFMPFAIDDFLEYYNIDQQQLKEAYMTQILLGFIFTKHELYDGKTTIQLARQVLDLNTEEEQILTAIEHAIIGFFEVVGSKENSVRLQDLFTHKSYEVHFFDIDITFKKGDVIEAKLARRLDGKLFFFGGFMTRTKEKKEILHDLQTYQTTETREAG